LRTETEQRILNREERGAREVVGASVALSQYRIALRRIHFFGLKPGDTNNGINDRGVLWGSTTKQKGLPPAVIPVHTV